MSVMKLLATGTQTPLADVTEFSATHNTHQTRSLDTVDFTFSSVVAGAADAKRLVIIAVAGFNANSTVGTCTSVRVGSSEFTKLVDRSAANHEALSLTLWARLMPSGTSFTVTVTHGAATACGIAAWRMVKADTSLTPTGTASVAYSISGTASPSTVDVSFAAGTPTDGAAILAASVSINGIDPVWTGLTESFARDMNTNEWFSGATLYPAGTGLTTVTHTEQADTSCATLRAYWR